ncbi:hypothetical protein [Clostridium tyrobutyricum]|nr:hypothetical protein [Clostridium tyrobutyricum]
MFKFKKLIIDIRKQQQKTMDDLDKKTTAFNKEWEKWGNKNNAKMAKKLP